MWSLSCVAGQNWVVTRRGLRRILGRLVAGCRVALARMRKDGKGQCAEDRTHGGDQSQFEEGFHGSRLPVSAGLEATGLGRNLQFCFATFMEANVAG